jgi:hypothetical protein
LFKVLILALFCFDTETGLNKPQMDIFHLDTPARPAGHALPKYFVQVN